jgi:hypothetical protein
MGMAVVKISESQDETQLSQLLIRLLRDPSAEPAALSEMARVMSMNVLKDLTYSVERDIEGIAGHYLKNEFGKTVQLFGSMSVEGFEVRYVHSPVVVRDGLEPTDFKMVFNDESKPTVLKVTNVSGLGDMSTL